MKHALWILMIIAATFGCAATVSESHAPPTTHEEEDASPAPADVTTDTTPTDANVSSDVNQASDAGDVQTVDATTDAEVMSDSGLLPPVTAALSPMNPPSRGIPRNSTGVFVAAYNLTSTGAEVPIRHLRIRRVGVGPSTDIVNVYEYGVTRGSVANTPFRYSTGRSVNPVTNKVTTPLGTLQAGATTTTLIYVDFGSATVGAQHAFELTGIIIEDGSIDGLLVPITAVRSNTITISGDLAGRLDVQRGSVIGRVNSNVPGEAIGSCRLRANRHDLDIVHLSFVQSGTVMVSSEVTQLEVWLGRTRIPISEWMDALNGYFVLTPITPIHLPAGTEEELIILGRVTSPSGRTIRMFLEYPTDIHVIDRVLNTPAAVCIASTMTGGCDGPNQGSFDGTSGNASETIVDP